MYYSDTSNAQLSRCFDYTNDGAAHEIMVTMTASTVSLSVDGSVTGTLDVLEPLADASGVLYAGRRLHGFPDTFPFEGTMRELRVHYSGSADLTSF